ncbi:hypothetical protein LJK87_10455 [Paenibacillus sp. P25]|nr:hypothetical protein LJK87_10455 [Paenibacillus sp. P25]
MLRKRKAIISLAVIAVLLSACSGKDAGPANEDGGQAAGQNEKADPFKLSTPIEVTTFKSVSPGAKSPEGDTAENNQYTRYIKDKTNISFKLLWYASGPDYTQKLNLAVASNDIPDMLLVDEATFLNLAGRGAA